MRCWIRWGVSVSCRAGRHLPAVTLNAVLVREVDPPEGEEPVEWLLLTTLPIGDVERVRQITLLDTFGLEARDTP